MKTGLVIFIALWVSAQAQPVTNEKHNSSCCIKMTPEKKEEIHQIGEEVKNFIKELSHNHEDLDFTLVQLKVEQHSDNEHKDKEIMLKILVNDCKSNTNSTKIEERHVDHNHYDAHIPKTPAEDTRNYSDGSDKDGDTETHSGSANAKQINESNGSDSENEGKNNIDELKSEKQNKNAENYHGSDSTEEKKAKSKKATIVNNHRNTFNGRNPFSKKGGKKDSFDFNDIIDQLDRKKLSGHYENSNLYIYAPTYNLDSSSFEDHLEDLTSKQLMNVERAKLYRKYNDFSLMMNDLQNSYENYPRDNFYYYISQPFSNHDASYSSDNMMNKLKNKI